MVKTPSKTHCIRRRSCGRIHVDCTRSATCQQQKQQHAVGLHGLIKYEISRLPHWYHMNVSQDDRTGPGSYNQYKKNLS